MTFTAGQSLSFYDILGPLGAGAMGEVYLAKDTRLEREVAIKVLPEHFAADEERLRRFEREAKSLASLNHPNVAQIFSVDQSDDTCFLVLELVPGETLEERIARGVLPIEEAVDSITEPTLPNQVYRRTAGRLEGRTPPWFWNSASASSATRREYAARSRSSAR
ncbi:MAG: serine/threonine protein kinase [Planctomycetota bacterium]|jgi:serine/threonine protein kinase